MSLSIATDSLPVFARRWHVRPVVMGVAVTLLLLSSVLRLGVMQTLGSYKPLQASLVASNVATHTSSHPKTLATSTAATSTSGSSVAQASTNFPKVVPPIPACTPTTFSGPTALDVSNAPVGYSEVIEQPSHYQIYGNTANQLEKQIAQCAPATDGSGSAEFTAETSYRLAWQYGAINLGNNQCKLSDVKVGLHVGMMLPVWQPTQFATSGLSGQWNTFMANLTTHEKGHVALDQQYAHTLADDLAAFPATDCGTLSQQVRYLIDSEVNTLNQANDNYDSQTNHGATQGAILP